MEQNKTHERVDFFSDESSQSWNSTISNKDINATKGLWASTPKKIKVIVSIVLYLTICGLISNIKFIINLF